MNSNALVAPPPGLVADCRENRYFTGMLDPILDPKAVGAMLHEYRRRSGLRQDSVARRAGLAQSYIGMLERGQRKPTVEVVSRLLRVYKVSWKEFGGRLDELIPHTDPEERGPARPRQRSL